MMKHLSELECSMFADDGLSSHEMAKLDAHFSHCAECQSHVAELRLESQLIAKVSKLESELIVPSFQQPATLLDLGIVAGVISVVAGLGIFLWQLLWQSLNAGFLTEMLSWFTSLHITDGLGVFFSTVLFIFEEGTTMLNAMYELLIYGLLFSALSILLFSRRELRGAISLCFTVMVFSGVLLAPAAEAIEFRPGNEMFTLAEAETIDDTLVVAGETTIINGTVNGDLVVFGRRVIVNGTVQGNLFVFTESVTVSGRVEGSVIGFANMLELAEADIGRDFWGFANIMTVNRSSNIDGNATVFSKSATIAGNVTRDLTGFAESIELSGRVNEDIETFAQRVNLIGDAYVGGGVRFHSENENSFQQSPSAVVIGEVEFVSSPMRDRGNRYLNSGFYVSQVVRLLMAFLAGLALFWFFPNLRELSLSGGAKGVKTAGIGLLSLIFIPIISALCVLTIVGIPFSVIGIFALMLGIYFAKIIVAAIIGRMLITSPEKQDKHALIFFTGLVSVIVLVNIPWVGGLFSFIMLIVGGGLIVQQVLAYSSSLKDK